MTAPEVRKAFDEWAQGNLSTESRWLNGVYPLWSSHSRRWYMRERMPGTRVWRLEDDMSFALVSDK